MTRSDGGLWPGLPEHNKLHVRQVLAAIHDDQLCAVLGPIFSGKSRVLKAARRELSRDTGYACAAIDLSRLNDVPGDEIWRMLALHIQRAPRLRGMRLNANACRNSAKFRQFLNDLGAALKDIKPVLFFDQLEKLPRNVVLDLLQALRAAKLDDQQPLVAVVSGALSLAPETVGATSPFNIARKVWLGDMSDDDNTALIVHTLGQQPYADAAVAVIRHYAGDDPELIWRICTDAMRQGRRDERLSKRAVERAGRHFIEVQALAYKPLDEGVRLIEARPDLIEAIHEVLSRPDGVPKNELRLESSIRLDPLYLTGLVKRVNGVYFVRNEIYRQRLLRRFTQENVGKMLGLFGQYEKAIKLLTAKEDYRSELIMTAINWVHSTTDKRQAAHALIEGVLAVQKATSAALYLVDDKHTRLERAEQSGPAEYRRSVPMHARSAEVDAFNQKRPKEASVRGNQRTYAIPLLAHNHDTRAESCIGVVMVEHTAHRDEPAWLAHTQGYLQQVAQALASVLRRQAQQESSLRLQKALNDIANIQSTDKRAAAIAILKTIKRVIPYDSASVQLLNNRVRRGRLEIVGADGFQPGSRIDRLTFSLDHVHLPNVRVFREGEPIRSGNAQREFEYFGRPEYHIQNKNSWLGVPLIAGGKPIGVLTMDGLAHHQFTLEHEQSARTFATQAAQTLQTIQAWEDARRQSQNLETYAQALEDISKSVSQLPSVLRTVAREVCKLTSANSAVIYPFFPGQNKPDRSKIESCGLSKSIREALRRQKSGRQTLFRDIIAAPNGMRLVPDVTAERDAAIGRSTFMREARVKAYAGIALRWQRQVMGVMFVNFQQPHDFAQDEKAAIHRFATAAAVAIQQAHAYRRATAVVSTGNRQVNWNDVAAHLAAADPDGRSCTPEDVHAVLMHLFRDADAIAANYLHQSAQAFQRRSSVLLTVGARKDGAWNVPLLVKLAPSASIDREIEGQRQIEPKLHGQRMPRLVANAVSAGIGAVAYSLIESDSWDTIERFRDVCLRWDAPRITAGLDRLFDGAFLPYIHRGARRRELDLAQHYGDAFGMSVPKLLDRAGRLREDARSAAALHFDGVGVLRNPIMYVLDAAAHRFRPWHRLVKTSLCHGDLHGANMLINDKGDIWLIDFARAGEGHILRDFVELETDIKFGALGEADPARLVEFERALLEDDAAAAAAAAERSFPTDELARAYALVRDLRARGRKVADLRGDLSEYYVALLFNTLQIVCLDDGRLTDGKKQHALLAAALLSERLA